MKQLIQASAVTLSFCLTATVALAQPYNVIDLGEDVAPTDINIDGVIVGSMNTSQYPAKAFIRDPADGMNREIIGGTVASAINDSGLVAGSTQTGAFVADSSGIIRDWDEQGVWGINASGSVSGNRAGNNPYRTTSIPYDPAVYEGNKWTVMGIADVYPRGTRQGVYADIYRLLDINDGGYTVGNRSRYGLAGSSAILIAPPYSGVKDAADVTYLPIPFGGSATAINNYNSVVGTSGNDSRSDTYAHAFLYDAAGTLTDLGTLMNAAGEYGLRSSAADINDQGQVVGSSWLVSANTSLYDPSLYHAFLWTEIDLMRDLNDLVPDNTGWTLTAATAINENGDIVGTGLLNGEPHGFLVTSSQVPVPPPVADNLPPVAMAGSDVTRGKAPLEVRFNADGSHDPEGSGISYAWDFGDGGSASVADPVHVFTDPRTYIVFLTVTDDQGQTDTVQLDITVRKAGGKR